MNIEFMQNAATRGDDGILWAKSIPEIVNTFEKKWNISVLEPFNLTWNYVAPAVSDTGDKVVLKIGYPHDTEFKSEIDALEIFQGEGIARLFEADRQQCVILIENVTPGISLSTLDDDNEATRIVASVMKKLWKPLPPQHSFITPLQWSKEISHYLEKYDSNNSPLPYDLVVKAKKLFHELTESTSEYMLVHGDLHHDNVLSSDKYGWIAIDPKGIAADPVFEVAAMIRNPLKKIGEDTDLKSTLENRINGMSEELKFDRQRILHWCFAQTILSAVWDVDNKDKSDQSIKIAEVLNELSL